MGISSCIGTCQLTSTCIDYLLLVLVFIFTFLLFLSGYVLQQQTVRSLQAAIHPPPEPTTTSQRKRITKVFGVSSGSHDQQVLEANSLKSLSSQVAHVQVIQSHHTVCNAIIAFADIKLQGSLAQKVLLYPREWDLEIVSGEPVDKHLETSMRLINKASAQYGVLLHPIDPILDGIITFETPYPVEGLLSLTKYNRLLHLQPNGLVLDIEALDAVFAVPMNASIVRFVDTQSDGETLLATLVNPSMTTYREVFDSTSASSSASQAQIYATHSIKHTGTFCHTSMLRSSSSSSSAQSSFISSGSSMGYMRFSDWEILGPEYDLPSSIWHGVSAKYQARMKVWQDLYDRYRQRRMEVCGLDLEPMPVPGT